jgi:predicted MFS family arabinose efflux permease
MSTGSNKKATKERVFTKYQVFMIAIIAILQFSIILDFMVISPLGAILLDELNVNTTQFGLVVSAYAFSAGASGLLAAGFADKYDRKKLLVFFYSGFIAGTILCALAPTYHILLIARIVTGIFGGVISSITFAIISDLFKLEVRGRVMGFVQMAFAASQILGLPIGLVLANHFGWHSPFWMIAGFSLAVLAAIMVYMKPITGHLTLQSEHNALQHFAKIISKPPYLIGFLATTVLATGGFMLMPFGSAFAIHNIGLTMDQLPVLYGVTGLFSIFTGPLIGKVSDSIGKYKVFCIGSAITIVMVIVYTHLGITPLWIVIALNVLLFVGILSRSVTSSALTTAVPEIEDRGAFMSINSAVQQISGGIASSIAGLIVVQTGSGLLKHYDTLGYVVTGSVIASTVMMYFVNQYVQKKHHKPVVPLMVDEVMI